MIEEYDRVEIIGFVGVPIMLMVPPWMYVPVVVVLLWAASVGDMLGLRLNPYRR